MKKEDGRGGGLMVGALDAGSRSAGSSPGQHMLGSKQVMDKHPIQEN